MRSGQGRPRLAFLGVGWIGRHRLRTVASAGQAEIVAIADGSAEALAEAAAIVPEAKRLRGLKEVLALEPDGVVIATPSAMHAGQAIEALQAGVAVFCQKPLGRNAKEAEAVVLAADRADRLLAVDLSYRHTKAMSLAREMIAAGELGEVFAAELAFHNAYGPDKPWFYDRRLSGGGCLIDLGIHLLDLALWAQGFPEVATVRSALFAEGRRLQPPISVVEDFADVELGLVSGGSVRVSCSWRLHAGRDAVISAAFFGTRGGVRMRNLNGSFYDLVLERFHGTRTERIVSPPDEWGGRAILAWAARLEEDLGSDPEARHLIHLSALLDRAYGSKPA